jgi:HEPN domain-containing protein
MDTNEIRNKFEQADLFLESAKSELNRPAEDVVSYMVCRSVRKSISYYLIGFLLKNGGKFDEEDTVEDLLKKCQALNSKFNNFDLSPITFTKDYEYSAEFHQMNKCIDLANYTKELVS